MSKPEKTVDEYGTIRYYLNGKRHREDGPAVEYDHFQFTQNATVCDACYTPQRPSNRKKYAKALRMVAEAYDVDKEAVIHWMELQLKLESLRDADSK